MNLLLSQLRQRHLRGQAGGVCAVCTSHPMVLRAAMMLAAQRGGVLLVEATANQVNPYGGYTGMTPGDYAASLLRLAAAEGLPASRLLIGADHMGPHPWKHEPAAAAMEKAAELARQCVRAGFGKIHLDTGMCCAGDQGPRLDLQTAAQRAAVLCRAAEDAAGGKEEDRRPLYVIGYEVPVPGGGLQDPSLLEVTEPDELMETLDVYEGAFGAAGVASAWQRVAAVVVQPGVEFGDRAAALYRSGPAAALSACHERLPGIMTFEVHSADYQSPWALQDMVRDHFLLIKVGPCLTFALRETLYALSHIEADMPGVRQPSGLQQVMESLMRRHPEHWRAHYQGSESETQFLRHFSLRDRLRYYWNYPEAQAAVDQLLANLREPIPAALLHQYFPDLFTGLSSIADTSGPIAPSDPLAIIMHRIQAALVPYEDACRAAGGGLG